MVFLMRVMLQYFKVLSSFFLPIEERKVLDKKMGTLYTIGYMGYIGYIGWIVVD